VFVLEFTNNRNPINK